MQQKTNSSSLTKEQLLIVAGLMTAVSLAALDITVVATVMPTVAGSLGGLDLFSWTFSIYLLTSTVTVPIYGKLADLYGRKPILLFGAVLFIIGSILCGASQSMEMLIVSRAVQGLGAGAVLPITITIIGDVFSIEQRSRVQGFMSGVWGVAGVAGPALGGALTDTVGWRWVFYLNVPFGLAAIALVSKYYAERAERKPNVRLDYWGSLLLTGAVVALLMAFLDGGERFGWFSLETMGMFAVAAVLFGLFLRQEMSTPEPVIPLSLFRNRIIAVSSVAIFVAGAVMFGVTSFVPLFAQGVFGGSATEAGMVLAPMSIAWVIAAIVSGKAILRVGYYPAAIAGGALLVAGSALLLGLTYSTSIWVGVLAGTIIGAGMGFMSNSTIIAVQNAVDWNQRGVATATTMFFRTIGGSIGIAIMGAILNNRIAGRFAGIEGTEARNAEALLDGAERAQMPAVVVEAMQRALASSLHEMFFVVFASAAICLAVLTLFPRGRVSELAAGANTRRVNAESEHGETPAAALH